MSGCAVWNNVYASFYGYNDNSCEVEFKTGCNLLGDPYSGGHTITTQGSGTYNDPSTCASSSMTNGHPYETSGGVTLQPGTMVYLPEVQQYFVMEDSCLECGDEYTCMLSSTDMSPGEAPPAGCMAGANLHIDFYLGPNMAPLTGQALTDLNNCEANLTVGGPYAGLADVIVNPPPDLPVSPSPLFSSTSSAGGTCWNNTTSQLNPVVCR
jgi:hypothetical protein